jgi:hypothetical protein
MLLWTTKGCFEQMHGAAKEVATKREVVIRKKRMRCSQDIADRERFNERGKVNINFKGDYLEGKHGNKFKVWE